MRENYIENKCKLIAEKKGYEVRKIAFLASPGCPDRIFFKKGHFFWVEFKNETGKLKMIQDYTIDLLKEANQEVYVINNVEDFERLLK